MGDSKATSASVVVPTALTAFAVAQFGAAHSYYGEKDNSESTAAAMHDDDSLAFYSDACNTRYASDTAVVLCSLISSEGFVVAGSRSGAINVWNLYTKLTASAAAATAAPAIATTSGATTTTASAAAAAAVAATNTASGSGPPDFAFAAHTSPVYAVLKVVPPSSAGGGAPILITASDENIRAFDWNAIVAAVTGSKPAAAAASASLKPIWTLSLPQRSGARGALSACPEANAIVYIDNQLFAAAGDGVVYAYTLPTTAGAAPVLRGKCVGHCEAVHALTVLVLPATSAQSSGSLLVSAGEDGTVRMWNTASYACVRVLEPATGKQFVDAEALNFVPATASTATTAISKRCRWLSCVAIDETATWLVTGGGARALTVWHLASGLLTATLPTAGTPQTVSFRSGSAILSTAGASNASSSAADDLIMAGCNESYVYHFSKTGKLHAKIKATAPSLFSISARALTTSTANSHAKSKGIQRVLVVTGHSNSIDVFLNPAVIATTLTFKQ